MVKAIAVLMHGLSLANSIERNGDGNPKLIGFSSDKEVNVNLSSAIFDNRALALLTGNDIEIGATDVYRRDIVSVGEANEAKLTANPVDGELLALYVLGTDGVEGKEIKPSEYTVTDNIITYEEGEIGQRLVAYYMYKTSDSAQTIRVSSDAFPAAFKLVMEVLVTDFHTQDLYPAQIIIPSARMEDDWALSFEPTGDPQALDMPIEILKPADSNDMFTMTIYENPED